MFFKIVVILSDFLLSFFIHVIYYHFLCFSYLFKYKPFCGHQYLNSTTNLCFINLWRVYYSASGYRKMYSGKTGCNHWSINRNGRYLRGNAKRCLIRSIRYDMKYGMKMKLRSMGNDHKEHMICTTCYCWISVLNFLHVMSDSII